MDNNALLKMARNGDKEARNILVQENTGLVWNIVKRFGNRGYESEDLFQIGCIGLIKAIDRFDDKYEVKLSTYAVPVIMGEIKRFIRDDGIIKISRSIKENGQRIKRARNILQNRLGREPKTSEIARETGLCEEEILEAIEGSMVVESIYSPANSGDDGEVLLIDKLAQKSSDVSSDINNVDNILNRITVVEMLNELEGADRRVIFLRYFREMTQTQVAMEMGINQVKVSRIEKRILSRLRLKLEE